jgi:outer membrane protein OmpA-like peptidoglycan-associated protein
MAKRLTVVCLTVLAFSGALFTGQTQALADTDSFSASADRFELGAFAGAHFFTADHSLGRFVNDPQGLSPQHGFAFGGRASWTMIPRLAVEAELLASPTKTRDGATSMWVLGYRISLLLNLLTEGKVRPFVLLGGGALSSVVSNQDVVSNDTDPFLHAGLGAKFALGETWGLRLDGRVLFPVAVLSGIGSVGDENKYGGPDFEVLAGVYFAMGEASRPEPVVLEPPPAPPPPPPPPPPAPPVDKDPDHDGIIGDADKCPNEPETVNGYQDDDGCPDEVPAPVKKFIGVIDDITFKYDESTLLASSFAILDKAVAMMTDFPETRWEISGHTDFVGTREYNQQLSARRAQAVVEYLVGKGIAADRLKAVGYGPDRPVGDNTTAEGRAKNRRTEFKLVSELPK